MSMDDSTKGLLFKHLLTVYKRGVSKHVHNLPIYWIEGQPDIFQFCMLLLQARRIPANLRLNSPLELRLTMVGSKSREKLSSHQRQVNWTMIMMRCYRKMCLTVILLSQQKFWPELPECLKSAEILFGRTYRQALCENLDQNGLSRFEQFPVESILPRSLLSYNRRTS